MKKKIIAFAVLILLLSAGGISAYFTASDEASNRWTVGNVSIELLEEEYDKVPETERQNITPNKTFTKDPVVRNTGTNDAFVFLEVSIPKASVRIAGADGSVHPEAVQELFHYGISDGWIKIKEDTGAAGQNRYVYAYASSEKECLALASGESTPPLFKDRSVTFANIVEGQGLEGKTLEIPIRSYAIQTSDLGEKSTSVPGEVWEILNGQEGSK